MLIIESVPGYQSVKKTSLRLFLGMVCVLSFSPSFCFAEKKPTAEQLEYFENHIRPVLVKNCYECHNSGEESESDVALDYRAGFRKGGENGPLIDFKNPDKSLFLKVLRHEIDGLEMPVGGKKLDPKTVEHFRTWLKMGAPDPRDKPPTEAEIAKSASWESIREKRKEWWSFQPIQNPPVPNSQFNSWSSHPVDRFIANLLEEKGLAPSKTASKRKLIRRLSFVLTGLPPTLQEIESFLNDRSPNAYEKIVDQYLASDHYGERWARHWMDWVRYTDTHGSEGDPAIPFAFQYRDYLIRALNEDIPYDQIVKEHIAGDLLTDPRINKKLGINESAIGTAHWRMVFHGFAPTDALDEKVRFTDDQINVFSKAFLGLTVSCARCHNHKFDAISQKDYYALFGILGSNRPATIDVNSPEKQNLNKDILKKLKEKIRSGIADYWLDEAGELSEKLMDPSKETQKIIQKAKKPEDLFNLWNMVSDKNKSSAAIKNVWNAQLKNWKKYENLSLKQRTKKHAHQWDMSSENNQKKWFRDGNGLESIKSPAGEFHLAENGDQVVTGIYPSGVYSHLVSNKHRGVFHSPRFLLEGNKDVWFQTIGSGGSLYRFVVQNYPRNGTVFPFGRISDGNWKWRKFNVDYWKGDQIHLEVSTALDQAVLIGSNQRAWFGVRNVIVCNKGEFNPTLARYEHLNPLFQLAQKQGIHSSKDLALTYQKVLINAIQNWKNNQMSDSQALILDEFIRSGILSNQLDRMKDVQSNIKKYRQLESEIPFPTRSPGVLEADNFDQPLMERGNHKKLTDSVPRRFLEAIDSTPYKTNQSGRLELANDLFREDNPFTSRMIVNRIWHYIFGEGIVATPDNFGRLGSLPTHPDLLDYLSTQMKKEHWSLKKMVRFLVMSKTFRQSSQVSKFAQKMDPTNQYLSHANLRRLDAESIRDSLLQVSGEMDSTKYGRGIAANSQGKRRSVYIQIKRNTMDKFLQIFDSPVPFATKGKRDVTNVPAQSLSLLNSPWVIKTSEKWIENSFGENPELSDKKRVTLMFENAFGERLTQKELDSSLQYINSLKRQYSEEYRQNKLASNKIVTLTKQIQELLKPAYEQLSKEKGIVHQDISVEQVVPDSLWNFEGDANDLKGNLHGKLYGNAKIQDGALILDGKSYVKTAPITKNVQEKTLEVWVQLENYDQSGGGVFTIQTLDGDIFDSIVYAERQSKHWLAGSNYGSRTLNFGGEEENEAVNRPVHLVLAYDNDGTIRCYRNGQPYGNKFRKTPLQPYRANSSQVLFGLRHGAPGRKRLLKGKILEARLYYKALTQKEIQNSAKMNQTFITEKNMIELLSEEDKKQLVFLKTEIGELENKVHRISTSLKENQAWNDFAHALFNLKKFIYID